MIRVVLKLPNIEEIECTAEACIWSQNIDRTDSDGSGFSSLGERTLDLQLTLKGQIQLEDWAMQLWYGKIK